MMMSGLCVWGLLSLVVLTAAQNTTPTETPGPGATTHLDSPDPQPSYLLLAPSALQPGIPTSVSVTILTAYPVSVSARIVRGNQILASTSATVIGGSTELLTLPPISESKLPNWESYMLEVKGHREGMHVFSNSTKLDLDLRGVSTFIQTDKVNYLPGQAVKIRVVCIHSDGRPFISPVDIIIRDPRGNLLRQWLAADSVLGIVSKEFQLSEDPPLGQWTIVATVNDLSSMKHFTVAHYVLPKFEVVIEAPEVIYREDTLEGAVTAKYTYGKPVQGQLNITFIYYFHGTHEFYHEDREIDGTERFTFDAPDYFGMRSSFVASYDGNMESVTVVAHVTEQLTGLMYNSTAKVAFSKTRYKVSFESRPTLLKPSLTFTAVLKVSTFNNQPLSLEDQQKTVEVSVMQQKYQYWIGRMGDTVEDQDGREAESSVGPEEMPPKGMLFPVPADGLVPFSIEIMEETELLSIYASFEDSYSSLYLERGYTSPSQTYLQIQKPSKAPQVGSPLLLHIQSNFPLTDVHYVVKSRGQVVSAGKSSANLTLVPEVSWGPLACILIYCVHPSGEVLNDAIRLPITQLLKNQVSLRWSSAVTRPAEDVTLKVNVSEPNSLVGVLVVDKATRWAGSSNDITMETVMKQMEEFGDTTADAHNAVSQLGDPYSVFKSCDLVVLTDASLHQMHLFKPGFPGEELMFFGATVEDSPVEEQHERWYFPETWVWMDLNTSNSNTKEIALTVPDSITTWTATAFVMSENLGLGVVERPAELTVFQDFFLSLNLPAFIIRGEELVLEIILFNYLQQDRKVTVSVALSETFEFVFPDHEELSTPGVHQVFVKNESGATLLIPIRPLVLGEIPVSVKAESEAASDFVRTTVLVKAEGLEQLFSTSLLLELSPLQSRLSRSVAFTFPPDVVAGSERASVMAVGDILGPSISGLDSLLQMPYGCGEQNMINFAPNIYILRYLSATGQDDQETTEQAVNYMMKGYERELSFQRADGSFSAFGEQDSSGSTWLSAFVLRCFLQARPFISIDSHVLYSAAAWIATQHGDDGSFLEPGRVLHTELQGGLDGPVSLTAYVLIALLEDADIRARYKSEVSGALKYLETHLGVSSNYSLSLLTYALALAGSSNAQSALDDLIGRADMRDGVPMWLSPDDGLSSSWQPRSSDIEMASYVLLAQHKLNLVSEGLSLMKWLSQQRNHRGGFGSTQDTVVALQALSTFAALGGTRDTDITIRVNASPSTAVASFHINRENYLLHQSQEFSPEDNLNLQVTAEGRGLALFQLNVFYNVRIEATRRRRRRREVGEGEAFDLHVELVDSELNSAHLHICGSLVSGLGLNATGMAIMEAGLLSGLGLQPDAIQTGSVVKKVETQPGKVILYLDSVTTQEMCVQIPLITEYKVAKVQEATVVLYDYYEPRRRTVRTYTSEWRSSMSSYLFCADSYSQCTENTDDDYDQGEVVFNTSSSSRRFLRGGSLPLLLLFFLVSHL